MHDYKQYDSWSFDPFAPAAAESGLWEEEKRRAEEMRAERKRQWAASHVRCAMLHTLSALAAVGIIHTSMLIDAGPDASPHYSFEELMDHVGIPVVNIPVAVDPTAPKGIQRLRLIATAMETPQRCEIPDGGPLALTPAGDVLLWVPGRCDAESDGSLVDMFEAANAPNGGPCHLISIEQWTYGVRSRETPDGVLRGIECGVYLYLGREPLPEALVGWFQKYCDYSCRVFMEPEDVSEDVSDELGGLELPADKKALFHEWVEDGGPTLSMQAAKSGPGSLSDIIQRAYVQSSAALDAAKALLDE